MNLEFQLLSHIQRPKNLYSGHQFKITTQLASHRFGQNSDRIGSVPVQRENKNVELWNCTDLHNYVSYTFSQHYCSYFSFVGYIYIIYIMA